MIRYRRKINYHTNDELHDLREALAAMYQLPASDTHADRFVSRVGFDEFELADLLPLSVVSGDAACTRFAPLATGSTRVWLATIARRSMSHSELACWSGGLWGLGDGRVGSHQVVAL